MSSKRILTGDRPTGPLHLGHYFGTLKNRLILQDRGHESFIIIADYQVLTDRLETADIEKNIYELVKDYIAIGLNPAKSIFFVQSGIPQLAELTLILSMLVSMSRVLRNPTVKEEVKSMGLSNNCSLGMVSYPVSQAADILLFNPNLVPVGEDQLPHLELTREIARKFNGLYGKTFRIPEPLLGDSPRLSGLDGYQKMSKSRNNAIFLSDNLETLRAKIMSAVTDSGYEIRYDPVEKPGISSLIDIYSLVSGKTIKEVERKYKDKKYIELKKGLVTGVDSFLAPIRERRKNVTFKQVKTILARGKKIALKEAEMMMNKVRRAMKMSYGF